MAGGGRTFGTTFSSLIGAAPASPATCQIVAAGLQPPPRERWPVGDDDLDRLMEQHPYSHFAFSNGSSVATLPNRTATTRATEASDLTTGLAGLPSVELDSAAGQRARAEQRVESSNLNCFNCADHRRLLHNDRSRASASISRSTSPVNSVTELTWTSS